jgi:hypothetical protein
MRAARRGKKLTESQLSDIPLNGLLLLLLVPKKQFPRIPRGDFPVVLGHGGKDIYPEKSPGVLGTWTYFYRVLLDLGYDYTFKKWLGYAFAVPDSWWSDRDNIKMKMFIPKDQPEITPVPPDVSSR